VSSTPNPIHFWGDYPMDNENFVKVSMIVNTRTLVAANCSDTM
jgi:hypothetical protein